MAFRMTRNLMAAAQQSGAGAPKSRFVKNWLSDSATYPIIGIMSGAIGLVCYQGQRIMFNHPDVTFDKTDRSSVMRENDDAAEKHHEHTVRRLALARTGETQIMPGVNNLMVASKVRN